MYLIFSGSLAACKIILEIGQAATLRQRDNQNRTPLILAAMAGHGEVVNFFLSEGGKHGERRWQGSRRLTGLKGKGMEEMGIEGGGNAEDRNKRKGYLRE